LKVRANDSFKWYRNVVLKLDKKDFRALQAGKIVDLAKEQVDKYPHIYEVVPTARELKDGDK
jgi:hypothetical protein